MQLINALNKYNDKHLKADPLAEATSILNELDSRDLDILKRAGFSSTLEEVNKVEAANIRFQNTQDIIKKYGNKNIFKTSAIKKLCLNYGLRFLPTKFYKGHILPVLAQKILEFTRVIPNGDECLKKSFIVAPRNAFNLTPRPKDPLYFVQLTSNKDEEENLFYLVHQWGGEINPLRYLANIIVRSQVSLIITTCILVVCNVFFLTMISPQNPLFIIDILFSIFCGGFLFLQGLIRCNNNKWDSEFEYTT